MSIELDSLHRLPCHDDNADEYLCLAFSNPIHHFSSPGLRPQKQDGIDKCCKAHDTCYLKSKCPEYLEYFVPYLWKCYKGTPLCGMCSCVICCKMCIIKCQYNTNPICLIIHPLLLHWTTSREPWRMGRSKFLCRSFVPVRLEAVHVPEKILLSKEEERVHVESLAFAAELHHGLLG